MKEIAPSFFHRAGVFGGDSVGGTVGRRERQRMSWCVSVEVKREASLKSHACPLGSAGWYTDVCCSVLTVSMWTNYVGLQVCWCDRCQEKIMIREGDIVY